MKSLIIIGAGGFGLEVTSYVKDCIHAGLGQWEIKGFLDDTKKIGDTHADFPILGGTDQDVETDVDYIIAIGAPQARQKIGSNLKEKGASFATLLHPAAYIADTAQIGAGTIFTPFSFAGPASHIGENALFNINSSVAHESHVGNFSVFSPYSGTHANAKVGDCCFLGAQSVITRFIKLGNNVKVAAGSVVYNNADDNAEAIGNPARFR